MKTKFLQPNLKLLLGSLAIVASLAGSFVTVHAAAKPKAMAGKSGRFTILTSGARPAVANPAEALITKSREPAEVKAQEVSAAAVQQAALQVNANATIQRPASFPLLPAVTCGAGNVRVEATNSGNDADYATLSAAFAAINLGTHTGTINIGICGDTTEPAAGAILNASGTGSSSYTMILITPTGARTVSGAATAGLPLIDLNGADNVKIDGLASGGNSLTISNTTVSATASTSTIRFREGATLNTVTNCTVRGSATMTQATAGGTIFFSTSTIAGGNSNNTISLCNISPAVATLPTKGVMSLGTTANPNATNTVSACNIFDYTSTGVFVSATGAGNGWTVSSSSFYQTTARTTALFGISIQGGSGHSVLNNSIGGTASLAGGSNLATSNTFRGIDLTVGTASATSVQGNTIKNIRSTLSGSFTANYGIFVQAGMVNLGNLAGNQVGSAVVAERYEISGDSYGIRVISTSTCNVSNNTINNFNTAPGVPTGEFYFGMSVEGTAGAHTVTNNTVMNVTNASVPDASFSTQTIGMIVSATGVQTIRGNTIANVGSTSTVAPTANNNRVWGLLASATAVGSVIEKNTVTGLFGSSAGVGARADVITCLQSQAVANGTYSNNMISGDGGGAPSDRSIFGILDLSASPAISNYYFNSVNIYGTATGANNTYAFNRNSTATITLRDNIFSDKRSGGTGFHVAIANTNAAATGWSATASDYNVLFNVNNTHIAQWLGTLAANNRDLPGWQAAQPGGSGGDANSFIANPLFVSDTNLHLQAGSPAIGAGRPAGGISIDFDMEARNPCTPDIGADEFVAYSGPAVTNLTITKTADSTPVVFNNQVGFVVKLNNTTAVAAAGLVVTDNLPAAPGVNWTIDAGATDPGWSVVGSPPTQSLQYSPSSLAGNTMTQAHVISATTSASCGSTLNNTASFTITNGCTNSGMASASIMVIGGGGPTTVLSQNFESGFGSWTTANNTTGGTTPAAVAWNVVTNPWVAGGSSSETLNSNSGTKFAVTDSDLGGSGTLGDTTLTSPSFNTVGYTSLTLAYRHYLRWLSNTSLVEVSTDGGGTWATVQSYVATQGAQTAFASASINLNAFVGNADVRVRFHYKSGWDWYWAIDDIVISGNAPIQPCPNPPMVTGVVSNKTHGATTYPINMPQPGPVGIECRSGGAGNDYTIVVTFDSSVTYTSVSVTNGTGSVSSVSGGGTNTLTVNLTGVTSAQVLTFTVFGATNGSGTADIPINIGVLVGDSNGDASVNAADIGLVKSQTGQPITGSNFKEDLNVDNDINAADVGLVKSRSGTALP